MIKRYALHRAAGEDIHRPGGFNLLLMSDQMFDQSFRNLPGAEIVLAGIDDLKAGRSTINAAAVRAAAPRLREAGVNPPPARQRDGWAAHWLYRELSEELGDSAHSRYNAILSRVASFARAAERARRG